MAHVELVSLVKFVKLQLYNGVLTQTKFVMELYYKYFMMELYYEYLYYVKLKLW